MRGRHLLALAIVSITIAACLGVLNVSQTRQPVTCSTGCTSAGSNSGSFDFGSIALHSPKMQMFAIGPSDVGDDEDVIDAGSAGFGSSMTIVNGVAESGNCGGYAVVLMDTFPTEVDESGCGSSGTDEHGAPPTIMTNGGCTVSQFDFSVTFDPTTTGTQDCTLGFAIAPHGQTAGAYLYSIALSGTGAQQYGVSVSPSTIDFGDVPTSGGPLVVPYTVTNTGTMFETVTGSPLSFSFPGDPGGNFTTSFPIAGAMLAGSASSNFNATCAPGSVSIPQQVDPITFSAMSTMAQLTLKCHPIVTLIGADPAPITFSRRLVGDTTGTGSGAIPLAIMNQSSSTVVYKAHLDPATASAGVTTDVPGCFSVNAGSSSTVDVSYLPNATQVGPLGSGLIVDAYGNGSACASMGSTTDTRTVAINGPADTASVSTNPPTIDFGSVCAGATSTAQLLDLYASGPGTFHVTSISSTGPFTFAPSTFTPSTGLAQGGHLNDIEVAVTTAPSSSGPVVGIATVNTDIPADVGGLNTPSTQIGLKATALPAGILLDQSKLHFQTVTVGTASATQTVTLGNCNAQSQPLTGLDAEIVGADAGDFVMTSPSPTPSTLDAGASLQFVVEMKPTGLGAKVATLQITYDGGMQTVALDGTGVAGTGSDNPRETYYACSAGRPIGALPIALALAFALRRRRR